MRRHDKALWMKHVNESFQKRMNENIINEKKYTINDLNDIVVLSKSNLDKYGGTFLLYDYKLKKPIGYISFGYVPNGDVFMVAGIYSEQGYGPLLYEMAMTYVYPNGLTLSQDGGTSGSAQYVWTKFEERGDVKKEAITRNGMSDKEEDLIGGCDGNKDCLEQIKKTIQLHNTKFIYSFGFDNLKKLLIKGNEYKNKVNFSDDDIEYMLWDLE